MPKLRHFALLFATAIATSYAASGHSASINFLTDVHVGTTAIPTGHYTLNWSADSGEADLTIASKKQHYSIPVTITQNPTKRGPDA